MGNPATPILMERDGSTPRGRGACDGTRQDPSQLDGSEAGLPDDAARQKAQRLLDERAVRHVEQARRERERKLAAASSV